MFYLFIDILKSFTSLWNNPNYLRTVEIRLRNRTVVSDSTMSSYQHL